MKTTITLLLTLLSFGYTNAQAPAIQWQKSLGGTMDYVAKSIQTTSDGGYVLAGYSYSINGDITGNHGGIDCWVVKLDASGTIQWEKSLGGSNDDSALFIQTTSEGGYIVVGGSNSTDGDIIGNHGAYDCLVIKLDSTGTIQWQKSIGGLNIDVANAIQTTSDGGYVIAGKSESTNGEITGNHGGYDYLLIKLDATGTIQWQKSLGGSSDDIAFSVQTTFDGGYIMAGYSNSTDGNLTFNHGSYDGWVVKLDATGTIQWQKSLGGTNYDEVKSIQSISDGGYIVLGITNSTDGDVTQNHGGIDYWVVKLDASGTIQWQKCLGGSNDDVAYAMQISSDGGYLIAGYSNSNNGDVTGNHGSYDYWITKLDDIGNIQWKKSLGGSSYDKAQSIQITSDGGYIVAGDSDSNDGDITGNHGDLDYWVVKLAPDALATPSFEMDIINIYPNPATDIVTITNNNSLEKIAKVSICDVTGKRIYTFYNTALNTITIDVSHFEKGLYLVALTSDNNTTTTKKLLLK